MKKILNQLFILAAVTLTLSACHKTEVVNISQPVITASNAITSDILTGAVKGTMLSGKTYYFSSDITINDGDTLLMQSGAKLIAMGDGKTAETGPEIFNHGTFISLGTQENPNYITVSNAADLHAQAAQQNYTNVQQGWWGGITCTPAPATAANPNPLGGDVIIKWTHLEFAGSPAGANDDATIYAQGDPRATIYFGNIKKNFIVEDSWFFGSKDDNVRTGGGHVSIMRNNFEICGGIGGEFFNLKSGSVGDVAYNLFIGSCTNALKVSDAGSSGTQCNVTLYNNTIINGGFRQTKSNKGGSIDFEKGARGLCYNNFIVNCRFGMRITTDADVVNVLHDNQYFYASTAAIAAQFYTTVDAGKPAPSDILSTTPKANNPQFIGYDVDKFDYTANPGPLAANQQPYYLVAQSNSDFRLMATSPAAGKGKTDFSPLRTVTVTGDYGTTITPPGRDIGAYQLDGSGNQH